MSLWEDAIGRGTHAERPAPGSVGALYCETDTGHVVRDSGTTWDLVASISAPSALTVVEASGDMELAAGNTLVVVTTSPCVLTLPAANLNTGQIIYLRWFDWSDPHTFTVAFPSGEDADTYWGNPGSGMAFASTGTRWLGID